MVQTVIQLRPIAEGDVTLLQRIYANTRPDVQQLPWTDADKQAFLLHQFNAQHVHYQQHFPKAAFDIVLCDGQPVGRLYVDRSEESLHIIDIALLAEHRGRGIGTAILRALLSQAKSRGCCISIMVERYNPAFQLYQRLGFVVTEESELYFSMQADPADRLAAEETQ